MQTLSDWIDLQTPECLEAFVPLLATSYPQVGVYDNVKTKEELLTRLKACSVKVITDSPLVMPTVLKLYDIGIGTPLSVTPEYLGMLMGTNRLDPSTPVHFRYRYGGLFLFILTSELAKNTIKSEHTYVALNRHTKQPWLARLGSFTLPNEVWMQQKYDGKVTTLDKALKVPYLRSYSIVQEETLAIEDLPQ